MAYLEEVGTATSFLNRVLHLGPAVDQRGGARRTATPEASQSVLQNAAAPAKRRMIPDGAVARPPLILTFFLHWSVHSDFYEGTETGRAPLLSVLLCSSAVHDLTCLCAFIESAL